MKNIEFVKWCNNKSECKDKFLHMDIALLDFSFSIHDWRKPTKGLAFIKKYLTLDEFKQFANEEFFESLRWNIPSNVINDSEKRTNKSDDSFELEAESGDIICLIDNKKHRAQYNYKSKELLFFDEKDIILNPEDFVKENK
jgi:hypothetical protein